MKKMISIALIILIVLFMFVPNKSEALVIGEGDRILTPEMVGQQIANWSKQFYNEHKDQCYYAYGESQERINAYNAPINDTTTYGFDCVGWVSFAVHHATGLGGNSYKSFVIPQVEWTINKYGIFDIYLQNVSIYNEADCQAMGVKPGDVLVKSNARGGEHVGIYVGDNVVIHSTGHPLSATSVEYFASSESSTGYVVDYVCRISESAAKNANFSFVADGVVLPTDGGGVGTVTGGSNNFEFNGLPNNVSYSSSQDNLWLFDLISQFFGFFAGMMINLLKYSIIGYIEMAEAIANIFLQSTTESLSQVKDIEYAAVQYVDEYSLRCY